MEIQQKMQALEARFRELKSCQSSNQKKDIINDIRIIASDFLAMMQNQISPKKGLRKFRITDILNKCIQIERSIDYIQPSDSQIYSQAQIARKTIELMVQRQMKSSQIRLDLEEVKNIANKMQKNKAIMKDIAEIIEINKSDINQIEQFIDNAYSNVSAANQQLDQAVVTRHRTVVLKVRTALYSFFGYLGYITFGIPGMIGSFFMSWKLF